MRLVVPGLAARAPRARSSSVFSPSLDPYTAAASPAGPAPDDDEVVERQRRVRREPDRLGQLAVGSGSRSIAAVGQQDDRLGRIGGAVERLGQAPALVVVSGSSQVYGTWLRVRKSRISWPRGAHRPLEQAQPLERRTERGGPVG